MAPPRNQCDICAGCGRIVRLSTTWAFRAHRVKIWHHETSPPDLWRHDWCRGSHRYPDDIWREVEAEIVAERALKRPVVGTRTGPTPGP